MYFYYVIRILLFVCLIVNKFFGLDLGYYVTYYIIKKIWVVNYLGILKKDKIVKKL